MKRNLLLAISVLALTAASQSLFAAEVETPAPRERAARQAQPARTAAQRAAPSQQGAQSSTSSFTGSQAGGFGGGNIGGGSFADPVALCNRGFNSVSGGIPCPAVPFNYDSSHKIYGTGGGFYSYSIPFYGWAVIGLQGEVAAGRIRSSSTQSNTHFTGTGFGPDALGQATTESYSSTFNQSTNGSILVKFGVPVVNPLAMFGMGASSRMLIYGLVGPTFAKIDGQAAYVGSNYASGCAPFVVSSTCLSTTNAGGYASWSETRTGIGGGIGAEWQYIPGVTFRLEYRYTSFGDISKDVPVVATTGCVVGGAIPCATVAHIDIKNLNFQTVRFGVAFGL
jgi:opacity protein-like surface antigen